MKHYTKYISICFFLLIYSDRVKGQELNGPPTEFLGFEASGLPGNRIEVAIEGKNVTVAAPGGFIKIYKTSAYTAADKSIYLKLYHKPKDSLNSGSIARDQQDISKSSSEIYLQPGSEMLIDVLSRDSDKLLRRYILQRSRAIPQISFSYQPGDAGKPFYVFNGDVNAQKLDIAPDKEVFIAALERGDFKNLEVEFTLLDLKAQRYYRGTIKQGVSSFKLAEDRDYELSVNYSVQKESVGTIFITVKPYWYNTIYFYIGICVALLVLVLLLFNKRLRKNLRKSKKEKTKLEESAIKLQSLLTPHFTFNALSSIQGLMNSGNIGDANKYLVEFSSLLRKSLSKSQLVFHSLDQELEMMEIYIRLEALRFNFDWHISVDESLNTSEIEIPTLLLQPLIENAIRHGLSRLSEFRNLTITCGYGTRKNSLVIEVKDNGEGLDPNPELGYGLSLTHKRIEAINQLSSLGEIKLDFESQSGTRATLTFINWLNA